MASLLILTAILFTAVFVTRNGNPEAFDARIRPLKNWRTAAVLWFALTVLSILATFGFGLVLATVLFLAFWVNEVRLLVAAPDDAFIGRNDKLIWALYLLFCPPVGAILFRLFRERNWAPAKESSLDWM